MTDQVMLTLPLPSADSYVCPLCKPFAWLPVQPTDPPVLNQFLRDIKAHLYLGSSLFVTLACSRLKKPEEKYNVSQRKTKIMQPWNDNFINWRRSLKACIAHEWKVIALQT